MRVPFGFEARGAPHVLNKCAIDALASVAV